MRLRALPLLFAAFALGRGALRAAALEPPAVLKQEDFRHYVEAFNAGDRELYPQFIPNAGAWEFLRNEIPFFECPDREIERTYYFRWWTYRKHLIRTPEGFAVTEFLPKVGWAGKDNCISCALGHHLYEGRWLHDSRYLDDDTAFWLRDPQDLHRYSNWLADAVWARRCVTGDAASPQKWLPALIEDFHRWEKERRDANGLFWQTDNADGMEVSIGGDGYRVTINSYLYGDARAIAAIAEEAGQPETARQFRAEADRIKQAVQEQLWDADAQFFKVRHRAKPGAQGEQPLAEVRELHGYTPWYFNLPDARCAPAWRQIVDPQGFAAPFGPTTAEQRDPRFTISYEGHECQWNGPSWPYATSVTLTGMANFLNGAPQAVLTKRDYFTTFQGYARSHIFREAPLAVAHGERPAPEILQKFLGAAEDGKAILWIDENLNPYSGDWISRTRLKTWKNGAWDAGKCGEERGKDYNHSTFCDLVITGLAGLRPRADETIEINPLAPEEWDYFCLDGILYHGHALTILYDKTGGKYGRGAGLQILLDGRKIASRAELGKLSAPMGDSGAQ